MGIHESRMAMNNANIIPIIKPLSHGDLLADHFVRPFKKVGVINLYVADNGLKQRLPLEQIYLLDCLA
jgi:hypothetical protein